MTQAPLIETWKAFNVLAHPFIAPIDEAAYAQALAALETLWLAAALQKTSPQHVWLRDL